MTEYKVVEWWASYDAGPIVGQIATLLNEQAADGWELDRFEEPSPRYRWWYFKRSRQASSDRQPRDIPRDPDYGSKF